jgi:hypothetical protein
VANGIGLLALGWSLVAGCAIDDRRVTVGEAGVDGGRAATEILVDNFEDAPQYSRDPRFQRLWQRYTYGAQAIDFHAERVESGAGSNWAYGLNWQLAALPSADPTGVGIVTPVLPEVGWLDLSSFTRIVISQVFTPGSGCAGPQRFIISLGCSRLAAVLEGRIVASLAGQSTSTLFFTDLLPADAPPERSGLPPTTAVSPDQCLSSVDEVRVQVALDLNGGGCAQGVLRIDDLSIR